MDSLYIFFLFIYLCYRHQLVKISQSYLLTANSAYMVVVCSDKSTRKDDGNNSGERIDTVLGTRSYAESALSVDSSAAAACSIDLPFCRKLNIRLRWQTIHLSQEAESPVQDIPFGATDTANVRQCYTDAAPDRREQTIGARVVSGQAGEALHELQAAVHGQIDEV